MVVKELLETVESKVFPRAIGDEVLDDFMKQRGKMALFMSS